MPDSVKQEVIIMFYEEYEAMRLCDYEMLTQQEASAQMQVSRPTLTRIYEKARQKLARALVEGLQISIEGGKVFFDSQWFHCHSCGCYFNNPDTVSIVKSCPLCKENNFEKAESLPDMDESEPYSGVSICLHCNYITGILPGKNAQPEICPKCGSQLAGFPETSQKRK